MPDKQPLVAVTFGSKADWEVMRQSVDVLNQFGIPNEYGILSAHRTPDLVSNFAKEAAARGVRVIIAGGSGAAHLPGIIAAQTVLPVIGVPLESGSLKGLDSLLSMVQMPTGTPVATLAIGSAGAKNAALLAASILALSDENIRTTLRQFREQQTQKVLESSLDY